MVAEAGAAARPAIWRHCSIWNSTPKRISTRPSKARGTTTAEQKAQEVDDALKKLDELAKREEEFGSAAAQRHADGRTEVAAGNVAARGRTAAAADGAATGAARVSRTGQQGQQRAARSSSRWSADRASRRAGNRAAAVSRGSRSRWQRSGQAGGQRSTAEQAADSRQQAAQQALDRLKQANDDMKRAASQSASAADSRRAADRLREATDLLGGAQQQDASGRLNSMAQTAEQLAQRQKGTGRSCSRFDGAAECRGAGRPAAQRPTAQEIDKMVNDRQKVADDLSHLTQQLRPRRANCPRRSRELRGNCAARSTAWTKTI